MLQAGQVYFGERNFSPPGSGNDTVLRLRGNLMLGRLA